MDVRYEEHYPMFQVCQLMPGILPDGYKDEVFQFTGSYDVYTGISACIFAYKDETFNMRFNNYNNTGLITCNKLCDKEAQLFIDHIKPIIVKPISKDDMIKGSSDMYFCYDGSYYCVDSTYYQLVPTGIYPEVNGSTMIWGGDVAWWRW